MEYWDAYDQFRKPLGYRIRRGDPIPDGAMHLVVHMLYYNSQGEVLVQRRSNDQEFGAGLWFLTVGSALAGETSRDACLRETQEELGFTPDLASAEIPITTTIRQNIVDVYVIRADVAITDMHLQRSEVAEVAWLDRAAFVALVHDRKKFCEIHYLDLLVQLLDEAGYIWNRS